MKTFATLAFMSNSAQTIFFVGKPASGKGTQAELLSQKIGWPIISMSDGLRELRTQGGALGQKLQEIMDTGGLTPDWLPGYVYLKSLFALSADAGAIFDGTSRSVPQAELIVESLTWLGRPFSVIYLLTSDDEIRNRTKIRRETQGRVDDHEEAVAKRIAAYYERTDKVIEFYRTSGHLVEVNGEGAVEQIHKDILAKLDIK